MPKPALSYRGYLIHLTHYDPRWCERKDQESLGPRMTDLADEEPPGDRWNEVGEEAQFGEQGAVVAEPLPGPRLAEAGTEQLLGEADRMEQEQDGLPERNGADV